MTTISTTAMRPFIVFRARPRPHFRLLPGQCSSRRPTTSTALTTPQKLIPAPKPGSGPILERRADRDLPTLKSLRSPFVRTMPIFLAVMAACALAIFNYERSCSSVVNSTLFALRTNKQARELLGDEIYFKHKIPWIWGDLNIVQGHIDIYYTVKGTKGAGTMKFRSQRRSRMAGFQTQEWSLEMDDGKKVELLDLTGPDPFNATEQAKPEAAIS